MLGKGFGNSVYLSIPAVIISSMLGSMNGYVLSKWKFKGSNLLFTFMLFGMFIPYQGILDPVGAVPSDSEPLRHYSRPDPGARHLWHPDHHAHLPQLLPGVPGELIESGTVDGAGFFGIYRHIVFPISVPAFVVVLIWQFTAVWNEFLFAVSLTATRLAAGHGGAGRAGFEHGGHRLRPADGRLADYRPAYAAGLYFPGPLLYPRLAGRIGERLNAPPCHKYSPNQSASSHGRPAITHAIQADTQPTAVDRRAGRHLSAPITCTNSRPQGKKPFATTESARSLTCAWHTKLNSSRTHSPHSRTSPISPST